MTQSQGTPGWYVEGDVVASVRKAQKSGTPKSSIIWGLEEAEFEDIPKERIKAIVESIPANGASGDSTSLPLSQDPSTDETPREQAARFTSVTDIQYLSPRETARVIGLTLEQFDGNTVRPGAIESTECDLYWNRQRMTVGLKMIPVVTETVGAENVLSLSDGVTTSDNTRAPSELAIVTNGKFTDKAKTVATDNGIHCFDGGHLEAWLRRAKITPEALGIVLEEGENHDGPLDDLVELPDVPSSIDVNPLEIDRAVEEAVIPDGTETTNERHTSEQESVTPDKTAREDGRNRGIEDTPKPSGETGTLYADPSEDGDYDAFDRFVDDIRNGESGIETPNSNESEAANTSPDAEQEESATTLEDISEKKMLFDLIRIKSAAGEPITQRDIRKHGSYSFSQFETKFGSVTNALDDANIEYDNDSL